MQIDEHMPTGKKNLDECILYARECIWIVCVTIPLKIAFNTAFVS